MSGNNRRRAEICLAAVLFVVPIWMSTGAQEPVPLTPNTLTVARDFLRTFYPELNGKKYFMNLETTFYYDDQMTDPFGGLLELSIRELPKGDNRFLPCPPGAKPSQLIPGGYLLLGDCPQKGIQPREFLSAAFHFDEKRQLVTFEADGPATGNAAAKRAFEKSTETSKNLTGVELIAAFKHAGGKYGPDDKDEFVKSLPITKLETFLGKLNVISVEFRRFSQEDRSDFSDEMEWYVRALATRNDGTSTKYQLSFEQYNGTLVGLCDMSTYPCNVWELDKKDKH